MVSKTCPLCGISPCSLFHLLNNCQTSVNQDRYNYRHDSILSYLYSIVRKAKEHTNLEIYADLAGSRVNGVTIPNDIIWTERKPDLVIINRSTKKINLVELTVPWDSGTDNAKQRKEDRYDSGGGHQRTRMDMLPHHPGNRLQGADHPKEQINPHLAVQSGKGTENQQRHLHLQQAGSPRLLLPLGGQA